MDSRFGDIHRHLGREQGIETVAKFIANEETLLLLQEIGVDYTQAGYLGEPNPGVLIIPSG